MTAGAGALVGHRRGVLANLARRTVVLAYHSVTSQGPPFLSIPPQRFETHLRVLRRRGFTSGGLDDLHDGAGGPRVLLTFDDGYRDNHDTAWPLLREHGFSGIFFIVPPLIGATRLAWDGLQDDAAGSAEAMRPMSWSMVDEMAADGMLFGSHTLTHPRLAALADEALRQELLDSRRAIEARVGRCDAIAYPFGAADLRVALAAVDAGYAYGFTIGPQRGVGATAMTIPRVAIDHRDDAGRFALKLTPPGRRALFARARLRRTG